MPSPLTAPGRLSKGLRDEFIESFTPSLSRASPKRRNAGVKTRGSAVWPSPKPPATRCTHRPRCKDRDVPVVQTMTLQHRHQLIAGPGSVTGDRGKGEPSEDDHHEHDVNPVWHRQRVRARARSGSWPSPNAPSTSRKNLEPHRQALRMSEDSISRALSRTTQKQAAQQAT